MRAVDGRNPEVGNRIADWFTVRDELFERRQIDPSSPANDEAIVGALADLIDIGDDLVAFFVPDAAARAALMAMYVDE